VAVFIKKPYISGQIGMLSLIKRDFARKKAGRLYFLCVFPEKDSSMMEIIRGKDLHKGFYGQNYTIVGIADGESAAMGLVHTIFADFCGDFAEFSPNDFKYFKPWILEGRR